MKGEYYEDRDQQKINSDISDTDAAILYWVYYLSISIEYLVFLSELEWNHQDG